MDWCNSAPQDPRKTYPIMGKALNTSGRHIHFNMCEWGKENPWEWGDSCAQSWRMSGDHTGTWPSTKGQIKGSAAIPAKYSGKPYGWNDMDMLETGNGAQAAHANGKEGNMTLHESITEFSMWAISASPLVVTTPIMNCTPEAAPVNPGKGCSVSLIKQSSVDKCELNKSFGCEGGTSVKSSTVWTNGCRGKFLCDGKPITCDVDGNGKHTCPCSGAPAVKPKCRPMLNAIQKTILLNKEVIAINQDVTPQGRPVKEGDLTVWARKLSDGSVAVAMYNENDASAMIGVDFTTLGWTASAKAKVRDLWAHTDNGTATGKIAPVSVCAHCTVVVRLTKAA